MISNHTPPNKALANGSAAMVAKQSDIQPPIPARQASSFTRSKYTWVIIRPADVRTERRIAKIKLKESRWGGRGTSILDVL